MSFSNTTIDGTDQGKEWPLFDSKSMKYLLIGSSKPVISKKPFSDEYTFWKGLPLLSKNTGSEDVLKAEL